MLRPGSLLARRPSAAMLVAVTALFVAFGGVGYAAVSLPNNSVGTAQIRNNAVSFQKIQPGSVGIVRINPSTVQARVLHTCTTGNSAITAIDSHGNPTCAATRPAEFDTSNASPQAVTSNTSNNGIASESLAGGTPYLVTAMPYISLTGTAGVAQHVVVTCELQADGARITRDASFDLSAAQETQSGSIPLELAAPVSTSNAGAAVACDRTVTSANAAAAAPAVDVTTEINAIQTSVNTTEPNTTIAGSLTPVQTASPAKTG